MLVGLGSKRWRFAILWNEIRYKLKFEELLVKIVVNVGQCGFELLEHPLRAPYKLVRTNKIGCGVGLVMLTELASYMKNAMKLDIMYTFSWV